MPENPHREPQSGPPSARIRESREGITIHAVGVGADEEVASRWLGTLRSRARSALDETTLRALADMTGGRYFRARDAAELEEIYRLIDEIEPIAGGGEVFRPTRELFHWPLGFSVALFALVAMSGVSRSGAVRADRVSASRADR